MRLNIQISPIHLRSAGLKTQELRLLPIQPRQYLLQIKGLQIGSLILLGFHLFLQAREDGGGCDKKRDEAGQVLEDPQAGKETEPGYCGVQDRSLGLMIFIDWI